MKLELESILNSPSQQVEDICINEDMYDATAMTTSLGWTFG